MIKDCSLCRAAALAMFMLVGFAGCDSSVSPKTLQLRYGTLLPWSGQAFDILVEDLNDDHHADISVIDHGGNHAQLFYQTGTRQWAMGPVFDGVGFHPGNLIRWPGEPASFVLSAEGDNALRVLLPDKRTGFKVASQRDETKPRYAQRFQWPGWGNSLVLSPFDTDSLFLLKGYDPLKGTAVDRIQVSTAEQSPSVLWPGPITVTDIDNDGSDDLLYATRVTREVFVVQAAAEVSGIRPRELAKSADWGGPSQVVAGDLNGDDAVDLLVPDETLPGKINVLLNDGLGAFKKVRPLESANEEGVTQLKFGADRDGRRYLLAGGYGTLSLYQVPQNWSDAESMKPMTIHWDGGGHASALAFEDIDGDGWLDLVLGRLGGERTLWVHYGPLWDSFKTMSKQGFNLDNALMTEKAKLEKR